MITKFSKIDTNNFDAVAQIYKAGIETGNATFETNIPSFEEWDEKHLPFGRIVIIKDGILVGWAALSKVSDRCVYEGVAEVSVYVSDHGKGLRTQLLQKLIEVSESEGLWTLQCGIMRENIASIRLHEKCGFRKIGYRENVGKLNGVWRDNILMERRSKTVGI